MDESEEVRADQRLESATRFYGEPPFDFTVGLGSIAGIERACERRGWRARRLGVPGRIRIEIPAESSSAEIDHSTTESEALGRALRRRIRQLQLRKTEALEMMGASSTAADHLFAGRYETLGCSAIRRLAANVPPE